MRKLEPIILIVIILLHVKIIFAQDDYQKWLKEQKKEYQQYISEQDKEFIEFLKKDWKSVDVKEGVKPFHKPKPQEPVIFSPSQKHKKSVEIPVEKKPVNKIPKQKTKSRNNNEGQIPSNNITETSKTSSRASDNLAEKSNIGKSSETGNKSNPAEITAESPVLKLNYFNSEVAVPDESSLDIPLDNKISSKSVAGYFEKLCITNYKITLNKALSLKNKMNLNDWGYCKLLFNIGKKIDEGRRNESYLFTWFMLVKSGYLVRVGYEQNKIYLLVSTDNKLYAVPYFRFYDEKNKYYILLLNNSEKEPEGKIYTYKTDYPGASRKLNFDFKSLPNLGNKIVKRVINFKYWGKKYAFPVKYNKNLIDYYHHYPNTNLYVYFHSTLSNVASGTLLPDLKAVIKNMKQSNAVNFLLHFVQDATKYETDQKQFGYEKTFFPEESLYYPYSDCEDRAVFFSYLVRNLLRLNVIGLNYPDHVSTAVQFNENVGGDYIIYNGNKFVVCDPTYLGADIGRCMPQYKGVQAKIINIK